jgi:hypothetical protein
VTTEEIIRKLKIIRDGAALFPNELETIDAAIERLRGDDWPRGFKSVVDDGTYWVMYSEGEGDFYQRGESMGKSCYDVKEFTDNEKLTGPARAEVLERLGIKVGG